MLKIEYISHIVLMLILAVFLPSTWVALVLNLPVFAYHLKRYLDKSYQIDPTEMYKEVKARKTESIVHIVYYVLLFGFYLYSFIRAVIDFEHSE